ncbi:MAG: 50S ribosomal protein L21 [Calditrichia bacterium]|nr:50S ribosomal protein L21 [Calditrichia bacterium]
MYAIVEIAGFQYHVEENKTVKVPYLGKEAGEKVEFDKVLVLSDDKDVVVGKPLVENAKVKASVVESKKGKKVLVFKKKRRKGYKKLNGHRQLHTTVLIENISK